jgi:hypothetical protein
MRLDESSLDGETVGRNHPLTGRDGVTNTGERKRVVLGKVSPISVLFLIAVLAVAANVVRDKLPMPWWGPASDEATECPGGDPSFCDEGVLAGPNAARIILQASEACTNTGYLCAELEESGSQRTYRWPDATTLLRNLHSATAQRRPKRRSGPAARRDTRISVLEQEALELIIDSRTTSSEPADITVSWDSGLSGSQLGVTRFRWSMEGGAPEFRVLGLVLATRSPADWRSKLKPQQVLLTAAHEMGHALGLPHSDSPRDVMYSTNTARSLSTRDFKTVDALYGLPNGAEITN